MRQALKFIDLARRYGDRVAIDGVSFVVEPGQMYGFVGPNGAGKTTTMRIVLGVLSADRGEVRWKDAPVGHATRRRFGYMPEERGLYPKMRVRAQLDYLAALHGVSAPEEAADRWIERLGISERAEDRVEQLSLGNQQRVQLAAALVHEPELLVLDEPFSGLDPVGVDVLVRRAGRIRRHRRPGRVLQPPARARRTPVRGGGDHQGRPPGGGAAPSRSCAGRGRERSASPSRARRVRRPGRARARPQPQGHRLRGRRPDAVLDAARAAGRVTYFALERPTLSDLFREAVK